MTGEQVRAARALLGWKAMDLAEKSGVSTPTIQRLDSTKGPLSGRYETIVAVKEALELAGIQFLKEGDVTSGIGVAKHEQGKVVDDSKPRAKQWAKPFDKTTAN